MLRCIPRINNFPISMITIILLYNYLFYLYGINLTSHAAKIIIPGPVVEGMGHTQVLSTLTSRLVDVGHKVSLLSGSQKCSEKFAASNASQTIYYRSPNATVNAEVGKDLAKVKFYEYNDEDNKDIFIRMYRNMAADCGAILGNNDLLERLKSENFDLLIGDMLSPCDIFIANILDIPWIAVTANRQYVLISNIVYRVPAELSYVPQPFAMHTATDKMSFFERLANVMAYFSMNYLVFPYFMKLEFVKIKEEYNIAPEMDIWEMSSKAELWLTQTSMVLDFPGPGLPNVVPVGGLGVRPRNALPKDLADFVAGSGDHGFIIFSLGSIIKFLPDAPETRIITSVLSKLPQRVVWKHDGPMPPNLGTNNTNIKTMKWLPQNDLLGHPKARLYLAHGGLNGIYESIYHAVPMVVIPLMLDDQKENAHRVATKGMGIRLERSKLTEEVLMDAITKVIYDTKYQETVTRYSEILRDKPPLETAVHWIEHVLKFGGSHLRPKAFELSWIQYHLIDVGAFLVAILLFVISLLSFIVYLSCRLCGYCNRTHVKTHVKED
ncbi:UDP-glucuronosyltransferase 2C1-like [Amphiura filiformis]|uniref:UDP-glucuronosyltransferase 2C1-like n=1 Tax=Amphiura filiformis TaxID=82378 RepID=UPI003B224595